MQPTRRDVLRSLASVAATRSLAAPSFAQTSTARPLKEVAYNQVTIKNTLHLAQMENARTILMGLSDDSLLMPFRKMAGQPAPGEDIGGWYSYQPDYNFHHDDAGLAPGATFGQWISALARIHAITGDAATREKVLSLNQLYAQTISTGFYAKTRFPAYTFDKLVCGLMDSHRLVNDPDAFSILDRTTDAALPELPARAVDREVAWRMGRDLSFMWDEGYTLPENLYLVSAMGAGRRYRGMATQYLDDTTFFDPLARGENVLSDKQAYSYVNALCSAMQAYLIGGSEKHLLAARNGFDLLQHQSFATGGWGPDETLRKPGLGEVYASLTKSHNSFETPCGGYAHMKLTRYLLRATRDGRYGDSMERIMWNTVLGALPLQADGRAFYSSDYNFNAQRIYSVHRWPCCSGTLPQVAADYGINSYLRESGAVWVNLYLPSIYRWNEGGTQLSLEQDGSYPETSHIRLRVHASKPTIFSLNLRIPAWVEGAQLTVNGKAVPIEPVTGFTSIRRTWKTGDVVELVLPMRPRLESLDAAHPETAALMVGPLVLFALGAPQPAVVSTTPQVVAAAPLSALGLTQPPITRAQAMAAKQISGKEWRIETAGAPLKLVPFTEVGDLPYTTYLRLT